MQALPESVQALRRAGREAEDAAVLGVLDPAAHAALSGGVRGEAPERHVLDLPPDDEVEALFGHWSELSSNSLSVDGEVPELFPLYLVRFLPRDALYFGFGTPLVQKGLEFLKAVRGSDGNTLHATVGHVFDPALYSVFNSSLLRIFPEKYPLNFSGYSKAVY